ncbi:MAG: hypothetical protein ABS52_01910 [Gemmatimonadetes bacterium SCN 70-22]|nr:MAG: hypothetical protein ABS52_01910 [Gemmatimonadetes bacterium SCN 70-22]
MNWALPDVVLALLALAATAALAAFIWHAVVVAPSDVQLTVLDVEVPGLPVAFDKYRIAVLGDFHHGPQQPISRARRAVALANSHAPHLVALLGDYGTSEWFAPALSRRWYRRTFEQLGPVLQQLRARDGVVAVIGNHDYYASGGETIEWLQRLGIRVLRGEALELPSTSGSLRVVGVDDFEEGEIDAAKVAALLAEDTPTIVLSHHPDATQHCQFPAVRFVLAGHTHGGQVVLPWIGAPVTRSSLCPPGQPSGWVANPHAPLFVTRGVGAQVPLRFGAPPEVVALTLRLPAAERGRVASPA